MDRFAQLEKPEPMAREQPDPALQGAELTGCGIHEGGVETIPGALAPAIAVGLA
jgi:hypothetical protein